MKVTYNWLKDFVDIKLPAKELADKLTMAGLEVVSLEEKLGDFIFEIEITSNRPDWLSVLGIAREVAVITNSKLKTQKSKVENNISKGNFGIVIEDKKDCPLYTARIIKNVKVGLSPDWLKKRLELVGCRSVNNIVDITNYLLFELGEPMHAFDFDKLSQDKIIVRRARSLESIVTIDGEERKLGESVLAIADKDKVVAIAGVMGGKDCEVTLSTKNILLEAAVFNPIIVRRSRQVLGLASESSYRFERGIDLHIVQRSSQRAAELIKEYCLGQEACFKAKGLTHKKEGIISFDLTRLSKILGINITAAKVKQILSGLGFRIKQKSKNVLTIVIPSFRLDINSEVDLIEEVIRIFGYERVPATLPEVKPTVTIRERRDLVSVVKNALVGLGANEVITYSLTDKESLNSLGLSFTLKPIEIMNPLSQEQEVLRQTLLFGLGRIVASNLNQKQDYISIFEIANTFQGQEKPQETLSLSMAVSGERSLLLEQGAVKDEVSLLNLKGILETIFERLGIRDYEFNPSAEIPGFKPGDECYTASGGSPGIGNRISRDIITNKKGDPDFSPGGFTYSSPDVVEVCVRKEKIGFMLRFGSEALNRLNIKNKNVFAFEVSLDKILSYASLDRKFMPLARFPGITRDISFVLKEGLSFKEMLVLLREKGKPLLRDVRITDYYKGKQIPCGYRGLTISCLYCSNERTLIEKEVQPVHNSLCEILTQQFGAKIR